MSEREGEIKFTDAMVITTGNRFYKAEATIRSDDSISLLIFFENRCSYEVGGKVSMLDILVNPSSRQDLRGS